MKTEILLPEEIDILENQDVIGYLDQVYAHFCDDFLNSKNPTLYKGKRVFLQDFRDISGKKATFWHVISGSLNEPSTTPDIARCKRIKWIRHLIENSDSYPCWEAERVTKRGRRNNICVITSDFGYIVILAKLKEAYYLVTAYNVEKNYKKKKLKAEYETYCKTLKGTS